MTLRFYNGEYRFVLVDTEVCGCTDVVRHMRWRCPSLSGINFITLIYLAILCFFVVTPKAVAQNTVAPLLVSGNVTIDTTEMVTFYTLVTSTVTEDDCPDSSDIERFCELPDCKVQLNDTCSWRTDYVNYCRNLTPVTNCKECVKKFRWFLELVEGNLSIYKSVLDRYDCKEQKDYMYNYSVWTCSDCEKAYKDWLCATQIPYIELDTGTEKEIQPCEKFCERTEARCPYFLPQKHYCGQRTFFCRGPRDHARHRNISDRCFTCDFSKEGSVAQSVEDMDCVVTVVNSTETSAASFCHTRGSVYPVLVGLILYILMSWTLSPTVIAGT